MSSLYLASHPQCEAVTLHRVLILFSYLFDNFLLMSRALEPLKGITERIIMINKGLVHGSLFHQKKDISVKLKFISLLSCFVIE